MDFKQKVKKAVSKAYFSLKEQVNKFESFLDFDLDLDLDLPKDSLEMMEPEKNIDDYNLEGVLEFLEEFIGVIILGFATYHSSIPNLNQHIQSKMVTSVILDGTDFWLALAHLNNAPAGFLKISPTTDGQFIEVETKDGQIAESMFRVAFLGGDAFEYLDLQKQGMASFHSEFKGEPVL